VSFRVVVPGSTSNLGSGFDTVSAALSLYLRLSVIESGGRDLIWPAGWELADENNAILQAMQRTARELGFTLPGLRIEVENEIPLRRGLGSSAAALVAGVKIVERLSGKSLTEAEILDLVFPLEGHPENLAASLLGGWAISRVNGDGMRSERLRAKLAVRFVAAIPETGVSTAEARAILPENYSRADTVFNLQRCALLTFAVSEGRTDLLAEATADRLHQKYRAGLIPGAETVLSRKELPAAVAASVHSLTVSGSGSTLLALVAGNGDEVGEWMVGLLAEAGTPATFRVLDLDVKGARVLER